MVCRSVRLVQIVNSVRVRIRSVKCISSKRLKQEKISIKGYFQNKQARYAFKPRLLSVSDNMKISIKGYCHNKQVTHACIPGSLQYHNTITSSVYIASIHKALHRFTVMKVKLNIMN